MGTVLAIVAVLLGSQSRDARLPPLAPKVQSAGRLVAALAAAGGTNVVVSPALADHSVFFYEKGVPLQEALNGVAWCLHASLTRTPSGFFISRSASDKRDADAVRRRLVASWIKGEVEAISKFRKERIERSGALGAFQDELTAAKARQMALVRRGVDLSTGYEPTMLLAPEKLMEGLIERIGYDRLARVPNGSAAIFEDDPTPGAYPLPEHVDLLDGYGASVAGEGRRSPEDEAAVKGQLQNWMPSLVPPEVVGYPDGAALKRDRLRLRCSVGYNRIGLTLEAFDRSGKRVLRAGLDAGPTPTLFDIVNLTRQAERDPTSKFVPLGGDSLAVLADLRNPPLAADERHFKLHSWVADPVSYDPLNFWVRDALAALSSDASPSCVAIDVPDSLRRLAQDCVSPRGLCLDTLRETLKEFLPMDVLKNGDLLAERPYGIEYLEAAHASRLILKRLAKQNTPVLDGSLRSFATVAASASKVETSLPFVWADQCDGLRLFGIGVQSVRWEWLNLVAGISEPDWQSLLAGGVLTAGQIGVEGRLRTLLSSELDLSYADPSRLPDIYRLHPMEMLGGDVGDCRVGVQSFSQPMYRRVSDDPRAGWGTSEHFNFWFPLPSAVVSLKGDQPVLSVTRADFEAKYGSAP